MSRQWRRGKWRKIVDFLRSDLGHYSKIMFPKPMKPSHFSQLHSYKDVQIDYDEYEKIVLTLSGETFAVARNLKTGKILPSTFIRIATKKSN